MEFNATFLIAAISFIVFVIIMNFIFYKPIEKIVNERENFVDDNYNEAKKNNLTSQKLIDDYNKKIDEANSEGKAIMTNRSNEARTEKAELIHNAHNKASQDIFDNQKALESVYDITKNGLQNEAKNLAEEISAKLFSSFNEEGTKDAS